MLPLIRRLLVKKGKGLYKILFILYSLFLFTVTLMPINSLESGEEKWLSFLEFDNFDKVVHFSLFFIFTKILYFAFNPKNLYLFFIPFLTGILIEILQYLMGFGRSFDPFDIIANTMGTICMIALIRTIEKYT